MSNAVEATWYAAGWNTPGYLPDHEPAFTQDIEEAREYLIDAMLYQVEYGGFDETTCEQLTSDAEDVNLWLEPQSVVSGDGIAYWLDIVPAHMVPGDYRG